MRNLVTETGRKQHIVRENAYHGQDGKFFNGLCGAFPKVIGSDLAIGMPDAPTDRRCKTCKRLYGKGAR